MTIYYSPRKNAFYHSEINPVIPDDKVEITNANHQTLLETLNAGGSINMNSGTPVAVSAPEPTLTHVQATLCAQIDSAADRVYNAIGGPSPGRMAEYRQAKTDAAAYKASRYSGDVPETVQCWATAQGWTAQQAADDILATSTAWESVLIAIRSARLGGKASVNAAANSDDANTAAQAAIANVQQAGAGA